MIHSIYIDYDPDPNDTLWIITPTGEIVVNLPHDQITSYLRDRQL